jgi:hypothetical protein
MLARGIAKQLIGTVVAVLVGWLAALLFIELLTAFELLQQPHYIVPEALLVTPMEFGFYMTFFIVPVWALLLVPLYLFLPSASVLWRWPVCMVCGTVAGVLVMALWIGGIPGVGHVAIEAWSLYIMAAIVGGATCLTGALTKRRFKQSI